MPWFTWYLTRERRGTAARRRRTAVVAGATAVAAAAMSGPLIPVSHAGGHVDAPSSVTDTAADLTDVYAFTSPDDQDMVTLIANVRPFQPPADAANAVTGGFPFAEGARYEIHTDADGDGDADTTYRWTFQKEDRRRGGPLGRLGPKVGPEPVRSLEDRSLGVRQTYTLERVKDGGQPETLVRKGVAAPSHAGRFLMPDYPALRKEAQEELPGGGRTLAGQSAEAFKADTALFGLYLAGTAGGPLKWAPDGQALSFLNVNSLVLQVPKKDVALNGDPQRNPVVGTWASVSRPGADLGSSLSSQDADYRQVSRQGNPHVAFGVFGTTVGLQKPGGPEDRFQQREPKDDHRQQDFMDAVHDPKPPHRIARFSSLEAPATPRRDVEALFMRGIGEDNGSKFGYDLNTHTMNADADPSRIVPAEELRLNLTTPVAADPKPNGVLDGDKQGFPNGRRLNDTIDPVLLRVLMGEPEVKDAGRVLPKPVVSVMPADAKETFPYLNPPHAVGVPRNRIGSGGFGGFGGSGR